MEAMNVKRKAVLARIKEIEVAIDKAKEYLESGKHADWPGFRPMFARKVQLGVELPPHKDWVKNVFLRRMQMALTRAEKVLKQLAKQESRIRDNHRRQRTRPGRSDCIPHQRGRAIAADP
ncbi:MAG TPA: hypothetical protein VN673_04545 [Clostridia bacterium]|nr:hypothetical protein [Clostridia bacterium]